jgi:hypothetical protein
MVQEHMKTSIAVFSLALVAGCAAQEEREASTQDLAQAVRDFIEVRELESLDSMKSGMNDSWVPIGDYFLIYKGRREEYLVEMVRRCHELNDNSRITPDRRWDTNVVRARFDTIRGCRIRSIYAVNEAEVAELKNIGETPGSRN